jgi:Mu transposase-like protein
LRPLPEAPFEPCDKRPAKVSSTALVRYRMNDYSVPTAYGFRDVLVKGFVDEVAIICGADEIARHPPVYGRGQFVFDPMHSVVSLAGKALEPAVDEKLQSSGKVISAKKLSAFNFARSEIVKLSNLLNETVAGHDAVGCA